MIELRLNFRRSDGYRIFDFVDDSSSFAASWWCSRRNCNKLICGDTDLDRRYGNRLHNCIKGRRCQAPWIQRSKIGANETGEQIAKEERLGFDATLIVGIRRFDRLLFLHSFVALIHLFISLNLYSITND